MKRMFLWMYVLIFLLLNQSFFLVYSSSMKDSADHTLQPPFIVSRFPKSCIEHDVFFYAWCGFQGVKLSDACLHEKFIKEWELQKFKISNPDHIEYREKTRIVDFITLLLELELRYDQLKQMEAINKKWVERGDAPAFSSLNSFMKYQLSENGPGTLRLSKEGRRNAIYWVIQHTESELILKDFSNDQKIWGKSQDSLMEGIEEIKRKEQEFGQFLG